MLSKWLSFFSLSIKLRLWFALLAVTLFHSGETVTLTKVRTAQGWRGTEALTSLLVQLVEDVQQLRVHAVDGLEERQHGAVVGDAAAAHVVALHAVKEGADGVLQSLEELLVVLLRLSVLVLLLKGDDRVNSQP